MMQLKSNFLDMCIAGTKQKYNAKQYIILIKKFTKPPEKCNTYQT